MKKTYSFTLQFLILVLAAFGVHAQSSKEKEKPPQTGTADAWRGAVPASEQPTVPQPLISAPEESPDNVEGRETREQTEKRILDLELRLMESLKKRDSVSLDHLLSEDFMLAGLGIPGTQNDKARFIKWTLGKLELKSYEVAKTDVRVLPSTAVVTVNYKRQASIAGAPSDGDFTVTNVWVRRAKMWKLVSHHVSQTPNP